MEASKLLILAPLAFVILSLLLSSKRKSSTVAGKLPPTIPLSSILAGLAALPWRPLPSLADVYLLLHRLHESFPISALRLPLSTAVFISDSALAHHTLVVLGSAVADRLPPSAPLRRQNIDERITVNPHGDSWRLLRRNLVSGLLSPSFVKQFAGARRWALDMLLARLKSQAAEAGGVVRLSESSSRASYALLAAMCFGEKLEDKKIMETELAIVQMTSASVSTFFFAFLPGAIQQILSNLWKAPAVADIIVSFVKARRRTRVAAFRGARAIPPACYVDTLFDLELPSSEREEGGRRNLSEEEIAALCAEFFGAAGHNTSIALEWIMAEIVDRRDVQERLAMETELIMKNNGDEEELLRIPYLRALVTEGLRRHPPSPAFPRYATKEFEVGGFVVPKGATVFFNVASMCADGNVWEEPLEFRPERFLAGGGDGDNGGGGKVMLFGAGNRGCPGSGLAVLHLSYFVAHLVKEFEWQPAAAGEKIDKSEKMEFFMRMKNPLRARISPRKKKITSGLN
ncbi:Cytochrome P450 89A2 [Apostasia shenzhenica]|uniref:Cytochrome P450 89A2 n=1 Tax=Apostasia shenzhenica TaxID=1088818 RepID=A0A2I0AQP7_9ASPA|nr:Cytochrome P450 89A2 [Apostasia shenzhenica]